ncbi:hypothetical protein SVIOM342S_08229 [Streptomyces violaceorubidus]
MSGATALLALAAHRLPGRQPRPAGIHPRGQLARGPLAQQRKTLEEWRGAHDVRAVAHLGRDPRGPDDLAALDAPVSTVLVPVEWPVTDRLAADGALGWDRRPEPCARSST